MLTADKPASTDDLTLNLEGFRVVAVRSKILSLLHRIPRATNRESPVPRSFFYKFLERFRQFRVDRGLFSGVVSIHGPGEKFVDIIRTEDF